MIGIWILGTFLAASAQVDIPAQTAAEAVRELARQSGDKLTVSSELKNEIVMLKAGQASAREIRNHLATVLDATWVEKARNSYALERSDTMRRNLERKEAADRRFRIARAIEDAFHHRMADSPRESAQATIESFKNWYESRGSTVLPMYETVPRDTPTQVLIERLVREIGPDRLAAMKSREPFAATHPAIAEVNPFGPKATEIVRQFSESEAVLAEMVHPDWLKAHETKYWTENVFGPASRGQNVGRTVLLAVRNEDLFQFLLAIFDEKGDQRNGDSKQLWLGYQTADVQDAVRARVKGRRFDLTNRDRDYTSSRHGKVPAIEVRRRLADLDKSEPLGFILESAIRQIAPDLPIAGRLSDRFENAAFKAESNGEVDLEIFVNEAAKEGAVFEIRNGWLYVRDAAPLEAEAARIDRRAFAATLREAIRQESMTLYNYSSGYVRASQSQGYSGWGGFGNSFLIELRMAGVREDGSWNVPSSFHEIIGSLSEEEWRQLRAGEKVDHFSLRAVNGAKAWLLSGPREVDTGAIRTSDVTKLEIAMRLAPSVANVRIRFSGREEPAVQVVFQGQKTRYLTAEEVANSMYGRSNGATSFPVKDPEGLAYEYGSQTRGRFTFEVAPEMFLNAEVSFECKSIGRPGPFADLPENFRERVRQEFERIAKQASGGL